MGFSSIIDFCLENDILIAMGTTSVYIFKSKKWEKIDNSNIDGDFCNMNFLYDKYFPNLPKAMTSGNSKIPWEQYPTFQYNLLKNKNLTWHEKTAFLLSKNYSYFKSEDIPLVVKALELMNLEIKPLAPNFNNQFISFLKSLKLENNTIMSLGYSSGGFWGTDAEPFINSLSCKLSDATKDKIMDNIDLNPSIFGSDIFQDTVE